MGAAIFFAGQVWRPQKMAGRGGGGGRRRPKMAAEARRRPLGRNGVVSPGGAAARWAGRGALGQRPPAGPLSGPRPQGQPPPPGGSPPTSPQAGSPRGRGRGAGVGGERSPRARPGRRRRSPAGLWGAPAAPLRPRPSPGPATAPRRRLRGPGGGRAPRSTRRAARACPLPPPRCALPARRGEARRLPPPPGLSPPSRPGRCSAVRVGEVVSP